MSIRKPNGLEKLGLENIGNIYYNLSYDALQAHEVNRGECKISTSGTAICDTGIFTGRSPKDKYFVDNAPSNKNIFWGKINRKIDESTFNELFDLTKKQLSGTDIYVMDVYAGASSASRRSIRFVTEVAWQAHFVKNMFIRPTKEELENFEPDFVVYNACRVSNKKFEKQKLNSGVYVCFNVEENISIIGGTWYGGEMKKGIFSMMNYWLPLEGKLSMHCSANVGKDGDTMAEQNAKKATVADNKYKPQDEDMKAYTKRSLMSKAFINVTDEQELRLSYTLNRSNDVLYPNTPMDAIRDDSNIYSIEYNIDIRVQTVLPELFICRFARIVECKIGFEIFQLLFGRHDKHIFYEMGLPCDLCHKSDSFPAGFAGAGKSIDDVEIFS
jgi:hypothetical protein